MSYHARIFLSLVLLPILLVTGQNRLSVVQEKALPAKGNHFWSGDKPVTWTRHTIYINQTPVYTTERLIRAAAPLPPHSIAVIEENGTGYTVTVLNRQSAPVYNAELTVPDDRGFPQLSLLSDGTLLLLDAVEQKAGFGDPSGNVRWISLMRKDLDHEKRLITANLAEKTYLLGMPSGASGHQKSILYELVAKKTSLVLDSLSLSLPYFFFPFDPYLVIIGSNFPRNDSPENVLLIYHPETQEIRGEVSLPTIPRFYQTEGEQLFLLYPDHLQILNRDGKTVSKRGFNPIIPLAFSVFPEETLILGGTYPEYEDGIIIKDIRLIRISQQIDTYIIDTAYGVNAAQITGSHIELLTRESLLQFERPKP